jgi:hypothetical protein
VTCTGFQKILRFHFKFQFQTFLCVFTRSIHIEEIVLFCVLLEIVQCAVGKRTK